MTDNGQAANNMQQEGRKMGLPEPPSMLAVPQRLTGISNLDDFPFHFLLTISPQLHISRLKGWDWGQEEKGTTEDEMAGWHHRPNGHEFE